MILKDEQTQTVRIFPCHSPVPCEFLNLYLEIRLDDRASNYQVPWDIQLNNDRHAIAFYTLLCLFHGPYFRHFYLISTAFRVYHSSVSLV